MLTFIKICCQLIGQLALAFSFFASGTVVAAYAADAATAKPATPAAVLDRDYFRTTFKAHILLERYIPKGAMLFFGDSHIMHLELDSLHPYPVNFGISGDTTAGLRHRLSSYEIIKTANAVLLEGGVNDLGFGSQFDSGIVKNYAHMLKQLPKSLDIYILAIFPVNETIESTFAGYNDRIKRINQRIADLCGKMPNCIFINVNAKLAGKDGQASPRYLRPKDGAHLNDKGEKIVVNGIRKSLKDYQALGQVIAPQEQITTPSLSTVPE